MDGELAKLLDEELDCDGASSFFQDGAVFRMIFLVKFLCVVFVISCGLATGESVDDLVGSARNAIDTKLWGVATLKLEEAAGKEGLESGDMEEVFLLLAETLVKGNQAQRAFEILEDESVRDARDAAFWRGQALAGTGRYAEAVEVLAAIAADVSNPFQREAALTAASLQLSLSEAGGALDTLTLLEASPEEDVVLDGRMKRVEILLDLGRNEEAADLLPARELLSGEEVLVDDFLEANLKLRSGEYEAAGEIFSKLLKNPEGQSFLRYNQAAIGRADSLAGAGDRIAATEALLSFIQSKPDAPLLRLMFERVISWLPNEIITVNHPTLVRLGDWILPEAPRGAGLIYTNHGSAEGAFPRKSARATDQSVFAMFARAKALHQLDTNAAKKEAVGLLQRIRLLAPKHFLSSRSLLLLAEWKLEEGRSDDALALFDVIRLTERSSYMKGEAVFKAGLVAFQQKDNELAARLFDQAAELLDGADKESAITNAALARLREDANGRQLIQAEGEAVVQKVSKDLQLEKALLLASPADAKMALDLFLKQNPDHAREMEVRLAIVKAALASVPPDLSLARAQIQTIEAKDGTMPPEEVAGLELAKIRLLKFSGEHEAAIEALKAFVEKNPGTREGRDASMLMGEIFFKSGNYNEARLVLEKLGNELEGNREAQAAMLLAARAAALGATVQSREEALVLFDKAIAMDGSLTSLVILEKARLNIALNRFPAAISSLEEAYAGSEKGDPSRFSTGLLLAEAVYAQGETGVESLEKALGIYNELVEEIEDNPAQFFRLQYLRGLILEKLPDPKNPEKKRVDEALAAYFAVLDRPVNPPPPEWEWFERSGFAALALLENAERWEAAISVAEKIATFKGPREEEASSRARQLRLKHMVWED